MIFENWFTFRRCPFFPAKYFNYSTMVNVPVSLLIRLVCAEDNQLVVFGDGVLGTVQQGVVLKVVWLH
jgi:hypothetical protein